MYILATALRYPTMEIPNMHSTSSGNNTFGSTINTGNYSFELPVPQPIPSHDGTAAPRSDKSRREERFIDTIDDTSTSRLGWSSRKTLITCGIFILTLLFYLGIITLFLAVTALGISLHSVVSFCRRGTLGWTAVISQSPSFRFDAGVLLMLQKPDHEWKGGFRSPCLFRHPQPG